MNLRLPWGQVTVEVGVEEQTGEVDDTQSGGRELCGYVNEVSGESGRERDGIV